MAILDFWLLRLTKQPKKSSIYLKILTPQIKWALEERIEYGNISLSLDFYLITSAFTTSWFNKGFNFVKLKVDERACRICLPNKTPSRISSVVVFGSAGHLAENIKIYI